MTTEELTWVQANQRYLTAALDVIRARLERHASGGEQRETDLEQAAARVHEAAQALPSPSALDALSATFGLSPFERDLLLLCAGIELDASIAARCASARSDPARPYPTFGLALAALPGAHWSALAPAAPLRRWRLLEVGHGTAMTDSPLRIDERVLHYLAGVQHLDERLADLVDPVPVPAELPASQRAVVKELLRSWAPPRAAGTWPLIQLCGPDAAAKRGVGATACAQLGLHLYALPADAVPASLTDQETLRRLWERDSALSGSALLVDTDTPEPADWPPSRVSRLLDRLGGPVILAASEPLRTLERLAIVLDLDRPTATEQHALWKDALGPLASQLNGQIDAVIAQFDLSASAIRVAAAQVAAGQGAAPPGHVVWDTCRIQARPRLDDLAQRIPPGAAWDDLILPEAPRLLLHEVLSHVRQRTRVYDSWGLRRRASVD